MKLQRLLLPLLLVVQCTCAGAQTGESNAAVSQSEVDRLVVLLDDQDPAKTLLAAGQLISLDDAYALSAVRTALASGTPTARKALAAAIGFAKAERYIPEVTSLLEAEEEEVGKAAMDTLASFEAEKILEGVQALLKDQEKPTLARVRAAKLLGGLKKKEAVEALMGVLDDSQPLVQLAAYESLRKVTSQSIGNDRDAWKAWWDKNKYKSRSEWLEDLLREVEKDRNRLKLKNEQQEDELTTLHKERLKDATPSSSNLKLFTDAARRSDLPKLQVYAIGRLAEVSGESKPAVAAFLIELLSSEQSPEVLVAVCAALGKVGDVGAKDALLGQLSSEHASVREAATGALGKEVFKLPEVIFRLSHLLGDSAAEVRAATCWSLGKLKAAGLSPEFLKLLQNDPAGKVRAEAITALAEVGNIDAVDAIAAALLRDEYELARYRAAEALGRLGGLPELEQKAVAVNPLCEALAKPDPADGVRRACVIALGQIGDPGAIATLKQALNDSYSEVVSKAWDALLSISKKEGLESLAALAQERAAQNDFERAVEAYQLLLKEAAGKPEHEELVAKAKPGLAEALVGLERLSDALAIYRELDLTKQPELWQKLANLLKRMKDKEQYKEVVDAIAALRSKYPGLGGEEISKQLDDLEAQCSKVLQSSGTTAPAPS
jgi:HEAT repeat protein